jgi:hypothetical protein
MHAAAVAATEKLELKQLTQTRAESLLGWLDHYGQHLTSFRINGRDAWWNEYPLRHLPCPDLLELKLYGCNVQLGAADGYPGVIQGCTKLTYLELWCIIDDAPVHNDVLDGSLSSLVHLQYLNLMPECRHVGGWQVDWGHPSIGGLSEATLPKLQHLTYHRVHRLGFDNLPQLGALTRLQELDLLLADDTTVGPSSAPDLIFPASLTALFLLTPVEPWVLSLIPTGLQQLQVKCVEGGPVEGPGSLLCGMARLQQLTQLVLHTKGPVWPPAGPAYSALTASTNLECMSLVDTYLPLGVWSHVFPAGRKLPHLTCLTSRVPEDDERIYEVDGVTPPQWGAADIAGLVSCCPNLSGLDSLPLQPGLSLSELHKLTTLTWLSVECNSDDVMLVEGTVKGLAALTHLRSLLFRTDCAEFARGDLLPLTRLTALRSLFCSLPSDTDDDDMSFSTLQVNTRLGCSKWELSAQHCAFREQHVLVGQGLPWQQMQV